MTTLTIANRQHLTAYMAVLDFQINKLTKVFNAQQFVSGSLMMSGRDAIRKDLHELITWDNHNPVPMLKVKDFLQLVCQDLIYKRTQVIALVQTGITEFKDETRVSYCRCSHRHTMQRNYLTIPGSADMIIPIEAGTWICNECESVIIS